jgi:hypothetical protein
LTPYRSVHFRSESLYLLARCCQSSNPPRPFPLPQHVFADTLRSTAVIIASVAAETVESVTPKSADATAALIVSILIALSLIPLISGLVRTIGSLRDVSTLYTRAVNRQQHTRKLQHCLGDEIFVDDDESTEVEGLLQAPY